MVETPGICTQTTICEVARSGRPLTVPLGSPFICLECNNSLVPPLQFTEPAAPQKMPAAVPLALVGAGLLVLGGAVFLGRELGEVRVTLVPPVVSERSGAIAAPTSPVKLAVAAPAPAPTAAPVPRPLPSQAAVSLAPKLALAAPASAPADPRPSDAPLHGGNAVETAIAAPPKPAMVNVAPGPAIASIAPAPAATQPVGPQVARAPAVAVMASVAPFAALALPDQSFSPVPVMGGSPAYPAELAADGRPGRVNVTCQIAADGAPSGCRAVASKGGPAFAATTLAWLGHAHVRFRPIILHGHPLTASRSWTLAIEEAPSLLAEAKRKQQEAKSESAKKEVADTSSDLAPRPAPATAVSVQPIIARQIIPAAAKASLDRPFSTHVVAGGAPVFPASYEESRPGAVTVQCTIEEDGTASLCRILKSAGGSAFGRSVQSWLDSGRVRFRPVMSAGHAVASEESWTIVFNSAPAGQ